MNLDCRTTFIHDSWSVPEPGSRPGRDVKFGWWLTESVDEILPSHKQFIKGPSYREPHRRHLESIYQPLHGGDIRLLCLHPGAPDEPLTGHMETMQLRGTGGQPSKEYDALSYVWGDISLHQGSVNMQGHTIEISRSVAHALTRLRLPTAERFIWIDFLCINQYDIEERNSQVSVMHEIFGYAQRTCIHLGVTGSDTTFGFQALETLRSNPATGWKQIWDNPDLVRAGILDVMQRSWWTRIWCIQEAVVAKEVVLICGEHSLTWTTGAKEVYKFSRSLKAAVLSPQWKMFGIGPACLNPLLEILRLQLDSGPDSDTWKLADQTPDLLDIAYDMRDRFSTDPRDKLFGVIALAQSRGYDTTDLKNLVNYSSTYMDVYLDFARITLPRDPFDSQSNHSRLTHVPNSRFRLRSFLGAAQDVGDGSMSSPYPRDHAPDHETIIYREDTHAYDKTSACEGDVCTSDISSDTLASMSPSVQYIGNEIKQAMAAVRDGNFETAAEVFICLGQSLRGDAHATDEPVKRIPSKVTRCHALKLQFFRRMRYRARSMCGTVYRKSETTSLSSYTS